MASSSPSGQKFLQVSVYVDAESSIRDRVELRITGCCRYLAALASSMSGTLPLLGVVETEKSQISVAFC